MSFIKRAAMAAIKPYVAPYIKSGFDADKVSLAGGKLHLSDIVGILAYILHHTHTLTMLLTMPLPSPLLPPGTEHYNA